jgi:membrane protease YdiL (CAAX protease family)
MRLGQRVDAALLSAFRYAGLAALAVFWTVAVSFGMVSRSVPAIPACAVAAALFCALHLRTRAQRDRVRLRPIPLPAWVVAAAAVGFAAFKLALDTLLVRALPGGGTDFVAEWLRGGGGWAAIVATGVLAGPFVEEVGFRGWIQGALERRFEPARALFMAAALFAVAHFSLRGMPSLLVGGLVFGYAFQATGSLWMPLLLHVTANATAAAMEAGFSLRTRTALVLVVASGVGLAWLARRFPPRLVRARAHPGPVLPPGSAPPPPPERLGGGAAHPHRWRTTTTNR